MFTVSTRLTGSKEMIANINKFRQEHPEEFAKALHEEMEIEVTEMKRRCPVDVTPHAPHPGNLRASIHTEEPEIRGNQISVVAATGSQAPYGIYVHENLEAHHVIGEAKFMESVLNESAPYMNQRIAARVHFDTKA